MIDILGYIVFALWCFAVYCTTPAAMRLGDDITAYDVAKNGPLPATFNCNFGGEQQEVIVNAP